MAIVFSLSPTAGRGAAPRGRSRRWWSVLAPSLALHPMRPRRAACPCWACACGGLQLCVVVGTFVFYKFLLLLVG